MPERFSSALKLIADFPSSARSCAGKPSTVTPGSMPSWILVTASDLSSFPATSVTEPSSSTLGWASDESSAEEDQEYQLVQLLGAVLFI